MISATHDYVEQTRRYAEMLEHDNAVRAARAKLKGMNLTQQFAYGLEMIAQGFETKPRLLSAISTQIRKCRELKKFVHTQPMTPHSLISEINASLPLNKHSKIAVLFSAEWALHLRVQGYTDITLITDVPCKASQTVAGVIGVEYKHLGEIQDMNFDVVVGNPPFSKGRKQLFNAFIVKAFELSKSTVAMITPIMLESKRFSKMNDLILRHSAFVSDNVADKFKGIGATNIKWFLADKRADTGKQFEKTPTEYPIMLPQHERIGKCVSGTSAFSITKHIDHSGKTAYKNVYKNNVLGHQTFASEMVDKHSWQSKSPWLVLVGRAFSSRLNAAVVQNDGTPWSDSIHAVEFDTEEEAIVFQEWVTSDTIANAITNMFSATSRSNKWVVTSGMFKILPNHTRQHTGFHEQKDDKSWCHRC